MRTLFAWTFALTCVVNLSLAQSVSSREPLNRKATAPNAHVPACAAQAGWNVVDGCLGSSVTSNSIVDATVFPAVSGDVCTQINAALFALPSFGGTVDARGLTGNLTCNSNPWNGFSGVATVLLGAATFKTTIPWVLPNKNRLFGIGRADPNSANTEIQWATTAPASVTPIIDMGIGPNPNFAVFVGELGVDCNGVANLIGIRNQNSQELSGVDHVNMRDCVVNGLDVEGTNSQNSGPYSNLEVNYSANVCVAGTQPTIPVNYSGSNRRGISGLTVNADSCTTKPPAGVDINGKSDVTGSGLFEKIHCENVGDCIRVGNTTTTHDVVIAGVQGCPDNMNDYSCTNVIHICGTTSTTNCSGTGGAHDIVVEGIGMNNGSGNLLLDDVTHTTLAGSADPSLGFYALGHGTNPNVISSSPAVGSQFNSHLGSKNLDTAGTCTLSGGSCTVNFATSYGAAPVCTANSAASATALRVQTFTDHLLITTSISVTGTVSYICLGTN
jgi:hypothetical protein